MSRLVIASFLNSNLLAIEPGVWSKCRQVKTATSQNGDKPKRRQTKTATGPKSTYKLDFVNYGPFSVLLTTFQLIQPCSFCSAVIS